MPALGLFFPHELIHLSLGKKNTIGYQYQTLGIDTSCKISLNVHDTQPYSPLTFKSVDWKQQLTPSQLCSASDVDGQFEVFARKGCLIKGLLLMGFIRKLCASCTLVLPHETHVFSTSIKRFSSFGQKVGKGFIFFQTVQKGKP